MGFFDSWRNVRLPDWLFTRLARAYRAQDRIRREEDRREIERQDRALRDLCARESAAHDSGMCGGYENGCRFFPCYAVGDRLQEQAAALKARAANTPRP
jgi:hypothetical protein